MNTANNFKIEIRTSGAETDSTIGLVSGTYKWALRAENTFVDCIDSIISRDGWQSVSRAIDTRTGGGNSTQKSQKLTIIAGFYTNILDKAPIEGLRMQVYRETYIGDEWFDEVIYTGQITTVDVQGDANIVNYTVESLLRDVALSNSVTAVGDVSIDGTVTGEKTYLQTKGANSVFEATEAGAISSIDTLTLKVIGGTPTVKDTMLDLFNQLQDAISDDKAVYYEGESGTHLVNSVVFGASSAGNDRIESRITRGTALSSLEEEEGALGYFYISSIVYNSGISGSIIIEEDNNEITIDDYNDNAVPYVDGEIIASGDGIIYKSLSNGTEYNAYYDKYLPYAGFTDPALAVDGVFYAPSSANVAGTTRGTLDSVIDWDKSTSSSFEVVSSGSDVELAGFSMELNFTGYRMYADKLIIVLDFDTTGDFNDTTNDIRGIFSLGASYQGGDESTAPANKVDEYGVGELIEVSDTGPYSINSMPAKYASTGDIDADRFTFYHPTGIADRDFDFESGQRLFFDATALIPEEVDGNKYYDQLRIFLAVYFATEDLAQDCGVTVRQVNLLEGYNVGIDGLKDNKVQIDNSAVNGTIPLAYTDAVKRQNLYGISSTAPVDGWGTEQVDQDGFGNDISTDYIMATIPDGDLVGDLGPVNASEYKKEIARSVPAESCYDQEGKETLVKIGDFPDENLALLTWQMVKLDTLKIVNYSPRYIQPSLSFKFGTKRLQINNVEADTYNTAYVLDELGLGSAEKQYLWRAGHALYEKYGNSTTQKEEAYKLVQDADGAYRVAKALYANMGYVNGTLWPRVTITAELIDNNYFDIGTAIEIDTPKITGRGVVTEPTHAIYGATNTIKIEAIDTEEQIVAGDILQTGSQAEDVLQTGSQSDDILQTGSN